MPGDNYLNGYSYRDIAALAGTFDNYWRSEFARLVRLADNGRAPVASDDRTPLDAAGSGAMQLRMRVIAWRRRRIR